MASSAENTAVNLAGVRRHVRAAGADGDRHVILPSFAVAQRQPSRPLTTSPG